MTRKTRLSAKLWPAPPNLSRKKKLANPLRSKLQTSSKSSKKRNPLQFRANLRNKSWQLNSRRNKRNFCLSKENTRFSFRSTRRPLRSIRTKMRQKDPQSKTRSRVCFNLIQSREPHWWLIWPWGLLEVELSQSGLTCLSSKTQHRRPKPSKVILERP